MEQGPVFATFAATTFVSLGTVSANLYSSGTRWFGSGSLAAGTYTISVAKGSAMQYNKSFADYRINNSVPNSAFHVKYNNGSGDTIAPGSTASFTTAAACAAANAGQPTTFNHSGGGIGISLVDNPYADNAGSVVYELYGQPQPPPPLPTVTTVWARALFPFLLR